MQTELSYAKLAVLLSADAVPPKLIPGSEVDPGQSWVPLICVPVWVTVTMLPSLVCHVPVQGFAGSAAAVPAAARAATPTRPTRTSRRRRFT